MRGSSAAEPDCLSPAQVETVRRAYSGVRMGDGRFAAMPLMRGGESDWVARMIGTSNQPRGDERGARRAVHGQHRVGDPKYDFMTFDPERDSACSTAASPRPRCTSRTRISRRSCASGGKLLLWHGFNDPGPSPLSTIAYYEAVLDAVPAARDAMRLFLRRACCTAAAAPDPTVRRADGDRELGRARHRADRAASDERGFAAVAPAVPVSCSCRATGARATRMTPRASSARRRSSRRLKRFRYRVARRGR